MELFGKAYEINLSFSLSDILSFAAICLTAWIALQTHKLQKRQAQLAEHRVNHEFFPIRNAIQQTARFLCLHVGLGFEYPFSDNNIEYLKDYDFVSHHFNQSIADNVRNVLEYYYDQQHALGFQTGMMENTTIGIMLKKDEIQFEKMKQDAAQPVNELLKLLDEYMKRVT